VTELELRLHPSMQAFEAAEWDALGGVREAPFLSHAFLKALEKTGCVGERKGWTPSHVALREGGRLVAAAPAYLKTNSEGEFVFDYAWANAAARAGIDYYPKLLVASPFTPATGARLLVAEGVDEEPLLPAFAQGLRRLVRSLDVSGAHVLFPTETQAAGLARGGMMLRYGVQFHWQNRGYGTFEDFLKDLPSKKRTQLRRERKEMGAQGIAIRTYRGAELTPERVDAMYGFYLATVDKFVWGRRYLNRAFFEELALLPGVEVVLATDGKRPIAGALNLAGPKRLFGRYWGAKEERPFLHFNVCYYHSIEDAIARGLEVFEPGAGGEHKVVRGFAPTITRSAHVLAHAGLARAVGEHLERERAAIERAVAEGDA